MKLRCAGSTLQLCCGSGRRCGQHVLFFGIAGFSQNDAESQNGWGWRGSLEANWCGSSSSRDAQSRFHLPLEIVPGHYCKKPGSIYFQLFNYQQSQSLSNKKKKGNSGENRTGTCFTSTLLLCYSQRGKCRLPIKGPTENGSQWFCFEFVTCLVFADCQQLNQLLHCLSYGSDTPSEP